MNRRACLASSHGQLAHTSHVQCRHVQHVFSFAGALAAAGFVACMGLGT